MPILEIVTTTLALTAIIAVRYLLVAWLAYALIWQRKNAPAGVRLNRDAPRPATIRHELKLSLLSSWIYALPAALALVVWQHGGTLIYTDVASYGVPWLILSGLIYLLIQDAYYYWLHRLMHHPALFRHTHAGHHRSRQPTPFASFSFPWAEAALNAWLMPALVFVIPVHPAVILTILSIATLAAVLNHAGAEVLPPWLVRGPVGAWLISATHHSVHHDHFDRNFGLYFRFWDRAMGTDRFPVVPLPPEGRG
ncbi:MAG TPA: sterol desaturase family protein [Caulobacteraceae bacterium]|jgi:sterol desaturase/sphingolipid hydroxylase (fatty acid hydroxylase superfamily)